MIRQYFIFYFFTFITLCLSAQTSVYIKGTGYNYSSNRVVKLNTQTLVNGGGRGLCLTIVNASTHQHVSSTTYDTYGNSAASDNLATALNNLQRGYIGILTSYDAWENQVTSNLKEAARRLGLFKLGSGIDYSSRRPYAAIFRGSGTSTNNIQPNHIAYEVMQSNSSESERAVIATWLIDDAFIGNNLTNALVSGNAENSGSALLVDDLNNVGIGTTTPDEKLAVNGKIHAKEVRVDLTGWSDFVFEKKYKLPTLEEVEQHIKEKGHLQNIPPATEAIENGILLGDMNAKLLQKIEELTLYAIDQEKKIETQENQLKQQEVINHELEERLLKLEQTLLKNKEN